MVGNSMDDDWVQIPLPIEGNSVRLTEAQPFLKWAGGKSQLLSQLDPFFPESFERYVEPFLGGGAVFFHLRARFPQVPCLLCDKNEELINCYIVVRDNAPQLMQELDEHLRLFVANRKDYYYQVRAQHNLTDRIQRASRMIFLNKTCFNGLWRVNANGEFNVPMGSHKRITLYHPRHLMSASQALQGVELVAQDFRKTLGQIGPGDFAYVDPPYDPASETANFTAYTKDDFGRQEQQELATGFDAAVRRGANLMLSNSRTPLIHELYRQYRIEPVQARRMINSQARGRGAVVELVVVAYSDEAYMRMVNNSARAWLLRNGYADIARMIDEILIDWQRKGKRTRRNWWDVLAGGRNGEPTKVEGRVFPVLRTARLRKGLPVTQSCICRSDQEKIPPIVQHVRWRKEQTGTVSRRGRRSVRVPIPKGMHLSFC